MHPFLQGCSRPLENGMDKIKRRVQSPRRRDFKDFSAAPRDFRSPNRFNGTGTDHAFLLPGYPVSPDEDEDSGADSLNEQISRESSSRSLVQLSKLRFFPS